jgi:heme oxygenase
MNKRADLEVLSGGCTLSSGPIGELIPLRMATGKAVSSLHLELRAATEVVHDRLHRHVGFAAIQNATIGLADYKDLIVRLYGFYVPFEAAVAIEPDRSNWLAGDLKALGLKRPLHALPKCTHFQSLDSVPLRLGALYVAEGSALGGRELARGLDRLLGKDVTEGRQFFIGRGARTADAWRSYLAQLSAAPPAPSVRAEIITGAVETFAAFEHWLNGWSTSSHG